MRERDMKSGGSERIGTNLVLETLEHDLHELLGLVLFLFP